MAEITFVKTRHVYDSYTDFWRLVELSGFPTIYYDELDLRQAQPKDFQRCVKLMRHSRAKLDSSTRDNEFFNID